jgi:hypothetical protein
MGDKITAFQIKQLRRTILRNLNMLYPSGMRLGSLYNTVSCMDETYNFDLFTKDITYLKEKGYIRFVDEPLSLNPSFRSRFAVLTCDGKDIADRIAIDPALEIG